MDEEPNVFTKLPMEENFKANLEIFKKKKMLSILEDWSTVDKRFMLFEFFSKADLINEKLLLISTDRDYKAYLKKQKELEILKSKKERELLIRIRKLKESIPKSLTKEVKEKRSSQNKLCKESPAKNALNISKFDYCDTLTTLKNTLKARGDMKILQKPLKLYDVMKTGKKMYQRGDKQTKSFKSISIVSSSSLEKSKSPIKIEKSIKNCKLKAGNIISLRKTSSYVNVFPGQNKHTLKYTILYTNKMNSIDLSTISFDTIGQKKSKLKKHEKRHSSITKEKKTLNNTKSEITFKSILREFIKDPLCRKMEKTRKSKDKVSERLAHSINSFFVWKNELESK